MRTYSIEVPTSYWAVVEVEDDHTDQDLVDAVNEVVPKYVQVRMDVLSHGDFHAYEE